MQEALPFLQVLLTDLWTCYRKLLPAHSKLIPKTNWYGPRPALTVNHRMWEGNYIISLSIHDRNAWAPPFFASSLIALIWAMSLAQCLMGLEPWSLVGTKPKNNVLKSLKESLKAGVGKWQGSGGRAGLLVGGLAHTLKKCIILWPLAITVPLFACTFTPLSRTLFHHSPKHQCVV